MNQAGEEHARAAEVVRQYYDSLTTEKIKAFVNGNGRVERAWQTVVQWAPCRPSRILEVGCGIGDICWRMSRMWPHAQVSGLDISTRSVQMARALFGSARVAFHVGSLTPDSLEGAFDLIVLMDVYEHIPPADRSLAHVALKQWRAAQGRIILSFPTPRHQAYLKRERPEGLQPVDEDVCIDTIRDLAVDTGCEVLLYQQINVWHTGDYAHAVLGNEPWHRLEPTAPRRWRPLWTLVRRAVPGRKRQTVLPPRRDRLAWVKQKLGDQAPDM